MTQAINEFISTPDAWNHLEPVVLKQLAPNGKPRRFIELEHQFLAPVLLTPSGDRTSSSCRILPPFNTLEAAYLFQIMRSDSVQCLLPLAVAKNLNDCGWVDSWQVVHGDTVNARAHWDGVDELFPTWSEQQFAGIAADITNEWPLDPWSALVHCWLLDVGEKNQAAKA
jgi:hypothetical protein